MLTRNQIRSLVNEHGHDIIVHDHMQHIERGCYQHGAVTTFAHSIRVACLAVWMADRLHLWDKVDLHSLVRAALLHDYFLYDWHDWDDGAHRLHGFTHGQAALRNAVRDFRLNAIERDSIACHMFPMTLKPPSYIEGYLVTMADKISATRETFSLERFSSRNWSPVNPSPQSKAEHPQRPRTTGGTSPHGAGRCWPDAVRGKTVPVVPVLQLLRMGVRVHSRVHPGAPASQPRIPQRPVVPDLRCGRSRRRRGAGTGTQSLVVFLLSMVGASILEYVTSWVMEALFHARWWDYSDYKFNLNGRICLLGAFVFGVGGVLITSVIQPQVAGVTDRLPLPAIHWLCGVLFVLTLIDLVVTVCGIMHFENSLDNLMAAMTHYGDAMKVAVSDVTGKMSESWKSGKEMSFDFMMRVRDAAMSIFNRQQRRMIASFPKLRTERNNDVLEQLRRILESLYRH